MRELPLLIAVGKILDEYSLNFAVDSMSLKLLLNWIIVVQDDY
jgi:hypothetical protein